MAETKKKTWGDVFLNNYNGVSDEAKALEPYIKQNYKGNDYIPWATMERLTYMQDEDASFRTILTDEGGLVHTDERIMHQQNIQKDEVISDTTSQMFSHFVKVGLTFMGKEFIEEYPIQDQDYSAARVYNQNLVNKALQRAKAKVAARATGLGLKLYEGIDLQFEETVKPELPKVEPKKEEPKVEKVEEVKEEPKKEEPKETTFSKDINEVLDLILNGDKEKVDGALQKVNVSLMKKFGKAISSSMDRNELGNTINELFEKPEQLLKTLKNLIG